MAFVSIDLFAGGGGASEGIRRALGVGPVIAVNHDNDALTMHAANHRGTLHLCENVLDVDPIRPNGRLDLLWASPDCTYHSRARGGKPMKREIRALPWVIIKWARWARPRVIGMENVAEIEGWGPLWASDHPDLKKRDRPILSRRGETWRAFIQELRGCGYEVEWKVLNAARYGAPTRRLRLVMIARCDGEPIVWPEPTHGPGCDLPFVPVSSCIDWDVPALSIFATKEEAREWQREQNIRVDAYNAAVDAHNSQTGEAVPHMERFGRPRRPLQEKTMARIAEGMRRYVLESKQPFLLNLTHGGRLEPIDEPIRTITAAHRGEKAVITPVMCPVEDGGVAAGFLVQTRNGEREGQTPRTIDPNGPLNTITAKGSQGAVVVAHMQSTHSGPVYRSPSLPLATITTSADGHQSLVSSFLVKYYGEGVGQSMRAPLHTVTTKARFGLVSAFLTKFYGTSVGSSPEAPSPTITATGGHLGLVTVVIDGVTYAISDITLRMLTPRELARAQGFDEDYILTGDKGNQIAKIGNSVPPHLVEAVIRAQFMSDLDSLSIRGVA